MLTRFSRLTQSPNVLLRWCLSVVLWLLVLLVQQAGWQHALSHVVGSGASVAQRDPGHAPVGGDSSHDNACQECLAFHAGVHAIPVGVVAALPVVAHAATCPDIAPVEHLATIALAYQSRAPPAFV